MQPLGFVKKLLGKIHGNQLYLWVPLRATQLPLSLPGFGLPPQAAGTWLGAAQALYQKCRQATLAGIPFLADLLLDRQTTVGGRILNVPLRGLTFVDPVHQMIDRSFLAFVAFLARFIIRGVCHFHSRQ